LVLYLRLDEAFGGIEKFTEYLNNEAGQKGLPTLSAVQRVIWLVNRPR
jgi:hypothetical protein